MRILFLGEIVAKAGQFILKTNLKQFSAEHAVDCVIANANGATGGFGLGKNHANMLRKYGVNLLTGGDCIFNKKDMVEYLSKAPWILRPNNLPHGVPGRGWGVYDTAAGPIGLICMLGQSGYSRVHGNNPFSHLYTIVEKLRERTKIIILNFHASTSAEKRTMAFYADGYVSAVVGTGTRCLTADAEIFPGGMAYISDAGRTGSRQSIYGMDSETEMRILLSRIPERSQNGWGDLRLQGILMDFADDGKAVSLETINISSREEANDVNSKNS